MNDDELKDWLYRVGVLSLGPGDVLVVRVDHRNLSNEDAERLRAYFRPVLGEHKMIILDDKIELSVLTKAEIEARAA